jgi:hypothetical protein
LRFILIFQFTGDIVIKQVDGYIAGYETCGLTFQNGIGQAKGYIVISENLKDTLAVYNLPQDLFRFPEEIFLERKHHIVNTSFPEQYRNSFKVRLTYILSSKEEVYSLGLKEACIIPAMYQIIETYRNCVPVIIYSAIKIK